MLGIVVYAVSCVVVALLLSWVWSFVTPIGSEKSRSPLVLILFLVIALGGPYAYVEFLTSRIGDEIEPVVKAVMAESEVQGEWEKMKVVRSMGQTASAVAVVRERYDWGGYESVTVKVDLVDMGEEWRPSGEPEILFSTERSIDKPQFPPIR